LDISVKDRRVDILKLRIVSDSGLEIVDDDDFISFSQGTLGCIGTLI
jgi:hypothetical protein